MHGDSSGILTQQVAAAVHVGADGVVDPCLPAGYQTDDGRVGSGVWQQCQQLVEAVIDPNTCKPVHDTPCPELPDSMPRLTGKQVQAPLFLPCQLKAYTFAESE